MISKTVTYEGIEYLLFIRRHSTKVNKHAYKVELENSKFRICEQTVFQSADELAKNLSHWVEELIVQLINDSRVLASIKEWDGVIK